MYFEQFYLACLAHASYMLGSEGEAAVVDPQRDVDIYLQAAQEQGLKIRHIFETHLHADFVSGHKELAARTGATIYIGERAGARFPHVALHDGSEVRFGDVSIRALETPGHTPEAVCLVVRDLGKSPEPALVLTGDTLFIGDVGRPDLSPQYTAQQLAGMLYDSLHEKLLRLPDSVLVYPAHGAGSLCGRSMRADRFSSIGTERLTNPALQVRSREDFVQQLTANLPPRPAYFVQDAELNREGAPALVELPPLPAIAPARLQKLIEEGANVLDTRSPEQFAAGHVPGSINIPLAGQFATWAGIILGLEGRPVLVAESAEKLAESRMRLARVGIEECSGCLPGGVEEWKQAGLALASLPQMTAEDLGDRRDGMQVLDVRRENEWQAGHIDGALWFPLDRFPSSLPEMDRSGKVAVHCKSGYRSAIACSLLLRAGYRHVINVVGGFDAWQRAALPCVGGS
jgi:glyoxylase-like metal-dependent hydrolase (beta-lactamase superfamily II)/rhodanese-related sulfurtransferase